MIYEIQNKNDLSGAMLIVRFPKEQLDHKALYTIQSEWPDFLIPFRYRSIDGQIECVYQLGNRSKLQYRYGSRDPEEYIKFWNQIINPLLECGDWFLKPFSFVLEPQYLYVDKDNKTVSYLYIPSVQDCVDASALQELASELSRQNSVTDPKMENKVLRAIMQGFQPREFLQMLRESQPKVLPTTVKLEKAEKEAEVLYKPEVQQVPPPMPQPSQPQRQASDMDDIVIDLNYAKSDTGAKKGWFGGKKDNPSEKKKEKKKEKKTGFFGGKKGKKEKEIVLGAAAERAPEIPPQKQSFAAPVWQQDVEEDEETTLEEEYVGCGHLRLVGDTSLPREIAVNIEPGQSFTIGRFDVSVGHKQSDFEFDKRTKAVSRHHAAIERERDGSYIVVDLSSSAGTFVDGRRLTPNVPCQLQQGSRIAFGTSGADYIWEE